MVEEVVVEIDENGDVSVEVNGVKGSTCEELTRSLEEALGKVTKSTRKQEYFQNVSRNRASVRRK
jgi:hypothetical protein